MPLTTVIGWRDANFIPEWRRPTIIDVSKHQGRPLSIKDFPPVEARVPRKRPSPQTTGRAA
ncbi:hypothetical protein [Novosphingobium sp. SG751A]|uniref:hypothetical protein n=1 Tax=Novosphingobium sp. SG751A TaxID=2587000 RepID=UPI0035302BFA